MKIILTGAGGYLGSNLKIFLSNFHEVKPLSLRPNNLDHIEHELLEFDPDVVIHCGWGLGNSYKDIMDVNQFDNIFVGCELLKSISKLNNVTFMGFGSFSEYGTIKNPAKEDDQVLPDNLYGFTKNSYKNISQNFCRINNNRWLWIRPCYVYGKNDVSTRLIPKVFDSCINKNDLVLNSCNSIVDYLYIDDFCSAINNLLVTSSSGVYNICSGKEYKISDVISQIQDITHVDDTISYDVSLDRDDSYSYICGDNKRLRATGWSPSFNLTDGLQDTLNYFSLGECIK